MAEIEYRIFWSASSNITFHGKSDWAPWWGFEETVAEVEQAIETSGGCPSPLLEGALEGSGFECWCEVREVGTDD